MTLTRRTLLAGLASLPFLFQDQGKGKKKGHNKMSNGLLNDLQLYNSAVGSVFKDRANAGVYDFTNHGGGVTFAAAPEWGTGRAAITPGDGSSWLQLARTDTSDVKTNFAGDADWTFAIAATYITLTGAGTQDIMDVGDNIYFDLTVGDGLYAIYVADVGVGDTGPIAVVTGVPVVYILTYQAIGGIYKGYVNNAPSAVSQTGLVPNAVDASPWTLGDYYTGSDPANLSIGGLAKWGRVLDSDARTAVYASGAFLDYSDYDNGGGGGLSAGNNFFQRLLGGS